ncbi:UNVERIFIED_CONTAM: hypothetical protein FKN15_058458 [Acipenser sinensis]
MILALQPCAALPGNTWNFKGLCKQIDHFPEDTDYEADTAEYFLRLVSSSSIFNSNLAPSLTLCLSSGAVRASSIFNSNLAPSLTLSVSSGAVRASSIFNSNPPPSLTLSVSSGAVRASSIFPILSVILLFMGGLCIAASEFYKSRHNIILSAGIFFVSAGTVRASSIFPILSVILLFMGGLCIAASEFYKSRHNIILSAGIFFVSAGLSNIIGIIVYISANAGDPSKSDSKKNSYSYGWSFYFGALSFIIAEMVGVLAVHMFIDRHKQLRAGARATDYLQSKLALHGKRSVDVIPHAAVCHAGLSNIIGIIVYISANAGDPSKSDSKKNSYSYGWSFYFGALSFIIAEMVGVLAVHMFIDRHKQLRAGARATDYLQSSAITRIPSYRYRYRR